MASSSEQLEAFRAALSQALETGNEARGVELARASRGWRSSCPT